MTRGYDALVRCFALAFPELPSAEIPEATVDTVASWDSLEALTLVALIEEEFAVRIPETKLAELSSFASFRDYLRSEHDLL